MENSEYRSLSHQFAGALGQGRVYECGVPVMAWTEQFVEDAGGMEERMQISVAIGPPQRLMEAVFTRR